MSEYKYRFGLFGSEASSDAKNTGAKGGSGSGTEEKTKSKLAAALAFDPQKDSAPQVVAKGAGLIAENILKQAKDYDIPVYEDEKLAQQLSNLEVGETIPRELFEVVAEVLVFISRMDREMKK